MGMANALGGDPSLIVFAFLGFEPYSAVVVNRIYDREHRGHR